MTRSRSWPVFVTRAKNRWCGDAVTAATPGRCDSLANAYRCEFRACAALQEVRFPCVPTRRRGRTAR